MEDEQVAQKFIKPGSHKGKGLAVFTSGGDSQGKHFKKLFLMKCISLLYLNYASVSISLKWSKLEVQKNVLQKILKMNS